MMLDVNYFVCDFSDCCPQLTVDRVYKSETCRPLKVRLQEYRKAKVRKEIEKSGMSDHIWKEKGNYLPVCDKVKMIDWEEHWKKKRRLEEAAHMLGYVDLLSRPKYKSEPKLWINNWKGQIKLFLK